MWRAQIAEKEPEGQPRQCVVRRGNHSHLGADGEQDHTMSRCGFG